MACKQSTFKALKILENAYTDAPKTSQEVGAERRAKFEQEMHEYALSLELTAVNPWDV